MITDAPETPYDLRFRFLGVPVRIHPWFWVVSALLGVGGAGNSLALVAMWVGCVFVSILVHEFGHALMGRRFGGSPSILLYSFGGLCYTGSERTPWQRFAVVLAGPAAGFLLFLLTLLVMTLFYRVTAIEHLAMMKLLVGFEPDFDDVAALMMKLPNEWVFHAYRMMVWINFCWTLVNLLPIWPLDGGQATQVLLTQTNRRQGVQWSHGVSFVTAGLLALFIGVRTKDLFITVFMGYFAFINFQILQSMHQQSRFGHQDEDWWRR